MSTLQMQKMRALPEAGAGEQQTPKQTREVLPDDAPCSGSVVRVAMDQCMLDTASRLFDGPEVETHRGKDQERATYGTNRMHRLSFFPMLLSELHGMVQRDRQRAWHRADVFLVRCSQSVILYT